jgi:hypothetical protein
VTAALRYRSHDVDLHWKLQRMCCWRIPALPQASWQSLSGDRPPCGGLTKSQKVLRHTDNLLLQPWLFLTAHLVVARQQLQVPAVPAAAAVMHFCAHLSSEHAAWGGVADPAAAVLHLQWLAAHWRSGLWLLAPVGTEHTCTVARGVTCSSLRHALELHG